MSRRADPAGRRLGSLFRRRSVSDPGGAWATEALGPLGRHRVECDVT